MTETERETEKAIDRARGEREVDRGTETVGTEVEAEREREEAVVGKSVCNEVAVVCPHLSGVVGPTTTHPVFFTSTYVNLPPLAERKSAEMLHF